MFNSYNDAQLMNDSFAFFYTPTNTFEEPVFVRELEPCDRHDEPSEHQAFGLHSSHAAKHPQASTAPRTASGGNGASSTTTTKEKLIDFCDNFAFALKGRVFIMETNFKRRMRSLRKFLSRRLPPWLAKQRGLRSNSNNGDPFGCSRAGSNGGPAHRRESLTSNLRDLLRSEQHHQREERQRRQQQQQHEPLSAAALGAQQERILTRLERIKRDNQKLFNMEEAPREQSSSSQTMNIPIWLRSGANRVEGQTENCLQEEADREKTRPSRHASRFGAIPYGRRLRQAAATCALIHPKKTCIVCYERAPNIVTLPCGHSDTCSDCFIEIIYMAVKNSQYPLRCVLCRQKVERIRCSRRLMLSVIEKNRKSNLAPGPLSKSSSKSSKVRPVGCRIQF